MSQLARLLVFVLVTPQLASAEDSKPGIRPEANQNQNRPYAAVSPNGHSMELVAIVRIDAKERTAWGPDGKKIPVSEKWGRITEVRNQNPTHGFIFRCRGFQKGQDLGWELRLGMASPILNDAVPEFVTISAKIPNEQKTTNLEVGVQGQWGPWLKVHADGKPESEKPLPKEFRALYGLVKSVKVEYGTRTAFILDGYVGNKQAEESGVYEAFVVDGDGKRHDRWGVGIRNGGPVPYFNFAEDEIAHFEYRMRPYTEWFTFENVPLEPGEAGKMKVSVRKVDVGKRN